MIQPSRYARRSSDFDLLIGRTEEHYWNPDDPAYINFEEPWRADEPLLPADFVAESRTAVWDRLDERQRVEFVNESARWLSSNLLHGEQGALSLAASLCEVFLDPGAQEYAANQAREEARHVHACTRYMGSRFAGAILPACPLLSALLRELVSTGDIYKKIVGMQILVEGMAMGTFTSLYQRARDPLLRRLCQLILTDEAFHLKFGMLWASVTLPKLSEPERAEIEDWALQCFNVLVASLVNADQKRLIYPRFGLDPDWVQGALVEALGEPQRRRVLQDTTTSVFRTLVQTLESTGVISDRTRSHYSAWVTDGTSDSDQPDRLAAEGLRLLKDVNARRHRIVRRLDTT